MRAARDEFAIYFPRALGVLHIFVLRKLNSHQMSYVYGGRGRDVCKTLYNTDHVCYIRSTYNRIQKPIHLNKMCYVYSNIPSHIFFMLRRFATQVHIMLAFPYMSQSSRDVHIYGIPIYKEQMDTVIENILTLQNLLPDSIGRRLVIYRFRKSWYVLDLKK